MFCLVSQFLNTIIAVYVIISVRTILSQSSGGILSSLQPIISSLLSTTTTTSNTSVDVGWSDCHLSTLGWIKAKLCPGCTDTKPCSK